ncbi:MAG: hypothetical protein GY722_06260, partial [bacterium]|nr:hypothetical protein [bacterium]
MGERPRPGAGPTAAGRARRRWPRDPSRRRYSYTYDQAGVLEAMTYPNGVTTTYVHDDLRRLVSLETRTAQGEVIQSHAYSLDAGGRRTRVTEHDGVTRSFTYDDLDRLTGETVTASGDAVHASTFTYDPVGNRLTRVHTDSGARSAAAARIGLHPSSCTGSTRPRTSGGSRR